MGTAVLEAASRRVWLGEMRTGREALASASGERATAAQREQGGHGAEVIEDASRRVWLGDVRTGPETLEPAARRDSFEDVRSVVASAGGSGDPKRGDGVTEEVRAGTEMPLVTSQGHQRVRRRESKGGANEDSREKKSGG